MKQIEPIYTSFEQAKVFKEKGLVANCKRYWVKYTNTDTEYKEMSDVELDNLDREIGIGGNLIIPKYEQWQVVEWLRVNYNIYIWIPQPYEDGEAFAYKVRSEDGITTNIGTFDSPQEAYSAAFDYILKEIL